LSSSDDFEPGKITLPDGMGVEIFTKDDCVNFQTALRNNYPGTAHCSEGKPLTIVRTVAGKKTAKPHANYSLRSHPKQAQHHHKPCPYGMGDQENGRTESLRDGVTVRLEGGWFRLATAMDASEKSDGGEHRAGVSRAGASYAETAVLHLLRRLWTMAGLTAYDPADGYRKSVEAMMDIHYAAKKLRTTMSESVSDALLLVPAVSGESEEAKTWRRRNLSRLKAAREKGKVLFLIGELMDWPPDGEEEAADQYRRVPLKALQWITGWNAIASAHERRRLDARFASVRPLMKRSREARVIVAGCAEVGKNDVILCSRLAVMPVSRMGFIPIESGFELDVALELERQKRTFRKPMIVGADEVRPDFELLDVAEDLFVLEVFGYSGPEYEAQMELKIVSNDEQFGEDGWWRWRPPSPMPPFPPAAR
jgi:hypothetical protein